VEEQSQMESNIFLLIVPAEARNKTKAEGGASDMSFAEYLEAYSKVWKDNSNYIKYQQ
jgi:hypothetical protein